MDTDLDDDVPAAPGAATTAADVAVTVEPDRRVVAGFRLRRLSDIVWRVGLLALAAFAIAALAWRLRVVTLPVFVALLLCTGLTPPVTALERRGWRPLPATAAIFVAFLVVLAGVLVLIVPPTVAELDGVGAAVTSGIEEVADWLVDGPIGLDREEVERYTADPLGEVGRLLGDSPVSVVAGVRYVGETLVGAVLTLVLTFMFLKDGRRFQRWVLARLPRVQGELVSAVARRGWDAFGGFLRGAALLGVVEGIAIGTTLWLVGAPLAIPVGVLTFIGAFFPIVGAVVAGALAVLATLATVGPTQAVVVLVVAVLVQQLDNDLLAPLIYGRSLTMPPAAILLTLTAGGSIGGIAGAFLAVPLVAAVAGAVQEVWRRREVIDPEPEPPDERERSPRRFRIPRARRAAPAPPG
jgi:predicted PurR-regulated permease PerM